MLKGRDVTEGIRIDSVLDTLEQNQTRRFFLQIYRRQHDEYFCFFFTFDHFFLAQAIYYGQPLFIQRAHFVYTDPDIESVYGR